MFIITMMLFTAFQLNAETSIENNLEFPLKSQMVAERILDLNDTQLQWISEKKTIIIGADRGSEPFEILTSNNEYRGIAADYLSLISQSLGITIKLQLFDDLKDEEEALQKGVIDVIVNINEKDKLQNNSTIPFVTNYPLSVWQLNGNISSDLAQIGYIEGVIDPHIIQGLYPKSNLVMYYNEREAANGIITSEVDGVIGDLISNSYFISQYRMKRFRVTHIDSTFGFNSEFGIKNSNDMLRELLSLALNNIKNEQRNEILRRWSGAAILKNNDLSQDYNSSYKLVNGSEFVNVGVLNNFAPFSYFNSKGNFLGITSDLLEQIEFLSGVKFKIKKYNNVDEILKGLSENQIDIAAGISMHATKAIEGSEFVYSRNYLASNFALIARKNDSSVLYLKDLENKKLAILQGHYLLPFLKERYPYIKFMPVSKIADGYEAVKNKRADAYIQTVGNSDYYISRVYQNSLQLKSIITEANANFSFVSQQSNSNLLNAVSDLVSEFTSEELDDIVNRWQTVAPIENPFWERHLKAIYVIFSMLISVILIASMRIFYQHKFIAHRRLVEKTISDQLLLLKTLVNETPHPIYVRDTNLKLVMHNTSYLQSLHIADGSLNNTNGIYLENNNNLNEEHYSKLAMDFDELRNDYIEALRDKKSIIHDRNIIVNSVKKTVYHWIIPYMDSSGDIQGIIGGWIDISDRTNLLAELTKEKIRADEANLIKSRFLANISHEIRTPMNAILGMLELAEKQLSSNHKVKEVINVAHNSAQQLLSLLGDVLDISKIEAGRLELKPEPVDIIELIESTIELFSESAKRKKLSIVKEIVGIDNFSILIDPVRFKQVLTNLLSNAIKFSYSGCITVSFEYHIETDEETTLFLKVKDQGVGICKDDQQILFQPFNQIYKAQDASMSLGGTGLGLTICQSICQKMNGEIKLTSEPGLGTTVSVMVKVPRISGLKVSAALIDKPAKQVVQHNCDINILVVDDHESNRQLLIMQLEHLGYSAHSACNGLEALEMCALYKNFDLIFTDVNMPVMNGYEFTRKIKQLNEDVKVIGYTANAQEEERVRCLNVGMNLCLFKPMQLEQIKDSIELLIPEMRKNTALSYVKEVVNIAEDQSAHSHIHPEQVLRICGFDPNKIKKIADTIISENIKDLSELKVIMLHDKPDMEALCQVAHKIKGAANIVVARELIDICIEIEDMAKMGNLRHRETIYQTIRELISEVNKEVKYLYRQYVTK